MEQEPTKPVLTSGEWESVLFACPDSIKALVTRLAIAHHHIAPTQCATCGRTEQA